MDPTTQLQNGSDLRAARNNLWGKSQVSLRHVRMARPAHGKPLVDIRGEALGPDKGRQAQRWHADIPAPLLPGLGDMPTEGLNCCLPRSYLLFLVLMRLGI